MKPVGMRVRCADMDEQICRLLSNVVASAFGVRARELCAPNRGAAPVAFARQAAMYLGHVVFGLNLTRLGRGFGRDRTTARHACRTIEECRDDATFDRMLGTLEAICCDTMAMSRTEQEMRS